MVIVRKFSTAMLAVFDDSRVKLRWQNDEVLPD